MLRQFSYATSLVLLVCLAWQVASRYLMKAPSSFTEEFARILLIWFGSASGLTLLFERKHVSIDFLSGRLGPWLQRVVNIVTFMFVGVLFLGSCGVVWNAFRLGQKTGVMGMPYYLVYLPIPLMCLFGLCRDLLGTKVGTKNND